MTAFSRFPGICETCGREKKLSSSKGKYQYYTCHPCKHKENPMKKESVRSYYLKKRGKSDEWYSTMLEKQNGVCAVCLKPEKSIRNGALKILSVDHDHRCCKWGCGKCVRGLLCFSCNGALGKFDDDADTLRRAASYLDSFYVSDINEVAK